MASSSYKENLILKGGFLLSAHFGNQRRSTVDIDFSLKEKPLNRSFIHQMMAEIIEIDLQDNLFFEMGDLKTIRPEDVYGGFRVPLIAKLDNIRFPFAVDIATGDPITPSEVTFSYQPLFEQHPFLLRAYNIETVIAEKMHSVLSRQTSNGRSKDFYDLYVMFGLNLGRVDTENLKHAVVKTFAYRKTPLERDYFLETLRQIEINAEMRNRWRTYSKTHYFARGVAFEDVISALRRLIDLIF